MEAQAKSPEREPSHGHEAAVATAQTVVYLTNACGELAGCGTVPVVNSDLDRIPFESGPGYVLPYLIEMNRTKYVCGNLEVAYADPWWGEDRAEFQPECEAREFCHEAMNALASRLRPGEIVLPMDEGMPGRLVVGVAFPLESVASVEETRDRLQAIFGRLAWMEADNEMIGERGRPLPGPK